MQNAGTVVMIAKRSLNLMLLASKSYPELIQFWHNPFPNIWPWLQGGWNGRMNEKMTSGLKWSQNSTRNHSVCLTKFICKRLRRSWNYVLELTKNRTWKYTCFNFQYSFNPHMKMIFFTLNILVIILMSAWICVKTPLLCPGERERLRDVVMKFPIFIIMIILWNLDQESIKQYWKKYSNINHKRQLIWYY